MSRLRAVAFEALAVLRDIGVWSLVIVGFVALFVLAVVAGCLMLGVSIMGRFP